MSLTDCVPDTPPKQCSKCLQFFPATLEFFHNDPSTTFKLRAACRGCMNTANKVWRQKNKEKSRGYTKKFKEKHPEKVSAIQRTYRQNHKDELKEYRKARRAILRIYQRDWRKKNAAKLQLQRSLYRRAHLEEFHAQERAYREKNAEKWKAYHTAYERERWKTRIYTPEQDAAIKRRRAARHKEHPEVSRLKSQERRARQANAPVNDLTAAQWREMQAAYDYRCAYCGKRCKGKLTMDHITPIVKGGSHTASNIVPACPSCNGKKHAGPPLTPVQPLLLTIAQPRLPKKKAG